MKVFRSEFLHSYKTYSFGYCQYAEREKEDRLNSIYEQGYLPYSGSPNIKNILYMSRSSRVGLKDFSLNSENRRIDKRFNNALIRIATPLDQFDYLDKGFLSFCVEYFIKRHGPKVMPRERVLTVLESGFVTNVVTYKDKGGDIVGYVFEVSDSTVTHFWLSFYDLKYVDKYLGMWLMIDSARHAQRKQKRHFYLGTVYGEKSFYKTNFTGIEFWDGNRWVADRKLLRKLAREDTHHIFDDVDAWKASKNLFEI